MLWLATILTIIASTAAAIDTQSVPVSTIVVAVDMSDSTKLYLGPRGDVLGEASEPPERRRDQLLLRGAGAIMHLLSKSTYIHEISTTVVTWNDALDAVIVPPLALTHSSTALDLLREFRSAPKGTTNLAAALSSLYTMHQPCLAIVFLTDEFTDDEALPAVIDQVAATVPVTIFVLPYILTTDDVRSYRNLSGQQLYEAHPLTNEALSRTLPSLITHIREKQCPMM